MAISLSVNMHWRTSAVVAMAMLVLMTVMSTATASAIPTNAIAAHRGRDRVGRPCSGRHTASVNLPSIADTDNSVSQHQLRRTLRSVSSRLAALYDDVNRLKTNYVSTLSYCILHCVKI